MPEPPSIKHKLSFPELAVALSAILVSLCALGVSLYQASIMRDQQRAAVWPYIEILPSNNSEGSSLFLFNKGSGPAKIQTVVVSLDGTVWKSWESLLEAVRGDESIRYSFSTMHGRVLASNDELAAISMSAQDAAIIGPHLRNINISICYCSVYDDCWSTEIGESPEPIHACEIDEETQFEQ